MKNKLNTIYIISKGRPQCRTGKTLEKMGYTGDWFIVCGDNDESVGEYIRIWGKDRIIIFDWAETVKSCDLLDGFGVEKMSSGAVPVRNATRKISEDRGEVRHWQFDDDYVGFYRVKKDLSKNERYTDGLEFEKDLLKLAEFANNAKIANVGFCLGNEAIPSQSRNISKRVFNAHNLPSKEADFVKWKGRMNDDLINAIDCWRKGRFEVAFHFMSLVLMATQSEKGGNTDIYKESGTVRKCAYAVLYEPKAVKLVIKFGRYHHAVNWVKIVPKLLNEKYV